MDKYRDGQFAIWSTGMGEKRRFFWHLQAQNWKVILQSEAYTSFAGAFGGITAMRGEITFDPRCSNGGEPYFVVKGINGEIIGCSQMYKSIAGMRKGILSVDHNRRF